MVRAATQRAPDWQWPVQQALVQLAKSLGTAMLGLEQDCAGTAMVVWHCIKAVHPLTLLVPPLAAEHTATLSKLPLSPAEAAERLPEMYGS